MRAAFNTLRGWAAAVRDWQQDALREMQRLDDATRQHMAHAAMSGGDPLTDSMYDQMQAAAEEGAQPPSTAGAWLTPEQLAALASTQADDWWLDWLIPAMVTTAVLLAAAKVAGLLG